MKHKILLVDGSDEVLAAHSDLLEERFEVALAHGAQLGLRACRQGGPFAAVVADCAMPDLPALPFLQRVREEWPETVAILLGESGDSEKAALAIHQGHVLRILKKPCPSQILSAAVESAVAVHEGRVAERQRTIELQFSRDALAHFAGELGERVSQQTHTLARLHRYAIELNSADALPEVARLAAEVATDVLGGRGVEVELGDGDEPGYAPVRRAGPGLSGPRATEPIQTKEVRFGSISVDALSPPGVALSVTERHMLASIASSAAVATHMQVRRKQRDDAQHAMILALARLAERRDNETGKHLERVAQFCELIAKGLRKKGVYVDLITGEFIDNLYRSAPLHDIGKVGIPDSILLKPGKLSPEEWEVMKTHAEIGAETLRGVMLEYRHQDFLVMSSDIAWCHHEKWDGSGYPRGLRGDEIPLSARILALADVYDALTSVRPYKDAWSHSDALEWIRERSGAHFDPEVVAAFVADESEARRIREALADTVEEVQRKTLVDTVFLTQV